jgi:hypothetical protein
MAEGQLDRLPVRATRLRRRQAQDSGAKHGDKA